MGVIETSRTGGGCAESDNKREFLTSIGHAFKASDSRLCVNVPYVASRHKASRIISRHRPEVQNNPDNVGFKVVALLSLMHSISDLNHKNKRSGCAPCQPKTGS